MSTGVLILKYLKKQGQTNTFRLARELGIDRYKIIEKLEKKQLIEFKSGRVKFLKFPEKVKRISKKLVEAKKALSTSKKIIKHKAESVLQKKSNA